MKIIISCLFFLLIYGQLFCQIKIVDSKTKTPIPQVHIVSENGVLFGISTINGVLNIDKIRDEFSIHEDHLIEISHISYRKKKIYWRELVKNKYLELNLNSLTLNTVTVSAKKSSPNYLVLKGYFRSYQLDNNTPKAYMDGIVAYFIPLHKSKSLKVKVLENRTFRNPELFETKIKSKGVYTATTGDRTGPPYIEKKTALNELKNYSFIDSTKFTCKILVGKDTLGVLQHDSLLNTFIINIDITSPDRAYSRSLLNYTTKFDVFSISERYASITSEWNKKSNLVTRTEYRKQFVSHKKALKAPIKVESYHEFYVTEASYSSTSEFKAKKAGSYFGSKKTAFSTNFWINLESHNIPKLPDFINNLLGQELQMY